MNPQEFVLDAARYGVPTREEMIQLRIWDTHYHGFYGSTRDPFAQHDQNLFFVERMGIEKVIGIDFGGDWRDPLVPIPEVDQRQRDVLERDRHRMLGIIRIDPSDPDASCEKMERWIRRGPCIGIKYAGFSRDGVTCSHPNNDPIIRLAGELNAIIYIHAWLKVGGTPRMPGGGQRPGDSTPMDVAILARRFPELTFICGHSGGDWELAARAVRAVSNVLFEFSGSDPHSGQVDYAVGELGADRIVWGGHGPSRSYSTELGKVLDADIGRADRMKILGRNYRKLAAPILRQKGYPIEI